MANTDDKHLVLEERSGNVLTLTMNRPARHHALNRALSRRLSAALHDAAADDTVHAVVLTGGGARAFCAGADMLEASGVETSDDSQGIPAGNVYAALASLPMPIIAAVNGYCYGGGARIAIGCDLRLASTTATFRLPGAEYGLVVAAATLPRLVGAAKAKELIFTARKFDAADALQWGLVSSLHAPDELLPAAIALATEIAANSPAAVRASKAVIDAATLSDTANDMEHAVNVKLRGSPEQTARFRAATKRVTGR